MSRTVSPHVLARQDRILAVLRDAEGFPLSTGEVARRLDETRESRSQCKCRCGNQHERVWRYKIGTDEVRPLLARMERAGHVERVLVESSRWHYWRAS